MKVILSACAALGLAASARATLYGDPLVERGNASDYPAYIHIATGVFVVPSAVLPAGTLNSFETWDQVDPGASPFPSAGQTLTAYLLRPTGNANEFKAVFMSSPLTVPTVVSSQVATFPVSPFPTVAGDRIAFYGQGVPVDTGAGSLELYYPTAIAPALDQTFILGSAGFPLYNQQRLYSFGADVTPVPEATTMIAGALLLLPFGASTLRILRRRTALAKAGEYQHR